MEISVVSNLDMIIPNKRMTKTLIRLHVCAGWPETLLLQTDKTGFLVPRVILCLIDLLLRIKLSNGETFNTTFSSVMVRYLECCIAYVSILAQI